MMIPAVTPSALRFGSQQEQPGIFEQAQKVMKASARDYGRTGSRLMTPFQVSDALRTLEMERTDGPGRFVASVVEQARTTVAKDLPRLIQTVNTTLRDIEGGAEAMEDFLDRLRDAVEQARQKFQISKDLIARQRVQASADLRQAEETGDYSLAAKARKTCEEAAAELYYFAQETLTGSLN